MQFNMCISMLGFLQMATCFNRTWVMRFYCS